MTRLTNPQFAALTGCDFTSASKIRHGQRQPSLRLFAKTVRAFNLDANDAIDAFLEGREAFTAYLNEMVFEPGGPAEVESTPPDDPPKK